MATSSTRTICVACKKEKKTTYPCEGCLERFCFDHFSEHRKNLSQQLTHIENDHDGLRQGFNQEKIDPTKHPLIEQINQWEKDSINKIKQTADRCREKFIKYYNRFPLGIEKKLNDFTQQIKEIRDENEFTEIDLNDLREKLQKFQEEILRTKNISIEQQSTPLIPNISLLIPFNKDIQWKQFGTTIVGGNGVGEQLDQLSRPHSICFDDTNQTSSVQISQKGNYGNFGNFGRDISEVSASSKNSTIYIVDNGNERIIEWQSNETSERIVAGGNGKGHETNQMNEPTDMIIDRETDSFIITDYKNRRVMRWSRQDNSHGQVIISSVDCVGLRMDKDGSLYVADCKKHEVRQWKKGETNGRIVAGGNGRGDQLNQLQAPTYIFVDDDQTLYVSDTRNHRVMKWMKDAKVGTVVAGGNGQGDHATQLSSPAGVIADQFGQIYVADAGNDRVMRWCEGAKEGTIVVGGNGQGQLANQLRFPESLLFDSEGNLYVSDCGNNRIQKYPIDRSES